MKAKTVLSTILVACLLTGCSATNKFFRKPNTGGAAGGALKKPSSLVDSTNANQGGEDSGDKDK